MDKSAMRIWSVIIVVILVVGLDFLFLRHLFWERLFVNILIFVLFIIIFSKYLNE